MPPISKPSPVLLGVLVHTGSIPSLPPTHSSSIPATAHRHRGAHVERDVAFGRRELKLGFLGPDGDRRSYPLSRAPAGPRGRFEILLAGVIFFAGRRAIPSSYLGAFAVCRARWR